MPVIDPRELFILLSKQSAEHRRPIATYDLSHLSIESHITPAGWEQAHDVGYAAFNLADFTEMNWRSYQRASRHPSAGKPNADEAEHDKEAIKSIADFIIAAENFRVVRRRAHPSDFRCVKSYSLQFLNIFLYAYTKIAYIELRILCFFFIPTSSLNT